MPIKNTYTDTPSDAFSNIAKKRILFVCHGNICRSPMAEFIFRDLAQKAGVKMFFDVESAAVSSEELGNPVYPPARAELARHGIKCEGKRARRIRADDYANFDLIVAMDKSNLRNMPFSIAADPEKKIHLMMEYAGNPNGEVDDPWYTGDFSATWQTLSKACQGLLEKLLKA